MLAGAGRFPRRWGNAETSGPGGLWGLGAKLRIFVAFWGSGAGAEPAEPACSWLSIREQMALAVK